MHTNLVLSWAVVHACMAFAQSPSTFIATGDMTAPRTFHTATLLPTGKVLISGGRTGFYTGLSTGRADLYDPDSGTFGATGSMATARAAHTATLLPDGRVLIAGGVETWPDGIVASAELYDPATGTFTATGNIVTGHAFHTAILLNNGKVLIIGGLQYGIRPGADSVAARAELYDPDAGTFAAAGPYAGRIIFGGLVTLLADSKVLVIQFGNSEVYDPATDSFTLTGTMLGLDYAIIGYGRGVPVGEPTTTLLTTGKVLVAGAENDSSGPLSAVLYDPSTGKFTPTGKLASGRFGQSATLLPDGRVLMSGGGSGICFVYDCSYSYFALASAELYDTATEGFTAAGSMTAPRSGHTVTILHNGRALIAGGVPEFSTTSDESLSSAELYTPPVLVPAPGLFSISGDGKGQGAILHAQTHQVASPDNPAAWGEALEIYLTGLVDGSVVAPQVAIGGRMAGSCFLAKLPDCPE